MLLVGKTRQYWTWIRINNSLPHKIYCELLWKYCGCNIILIFIELKFLWFSSKGVQPVATPRLCQGVPKNTLTWIFFFLYIIIKIFLFVYSLRKNRNILNQNEEHPQKNFKQAHQEKKKSPKKFWSKIWKKKKKL